MFMKGRVLKYIIFQRYRVFNRLQQFKISPKSKISQHSHVKEDEQTFISRPYLSKIQFLPLITRKKNTSKYKISAKIGTEYQPLDSVMLGCFKGSTCCKWGPQSHNETAASLANEPHTESHTSFTDILQLLDISMFKHCSPSDHRTVPCRTQSV